MRRLVAIVIAVIIGLGVSCNGFREDEIDCEKAVVHVSECCPSFIARSLDCSYHESLDCSDSVVSREYPDLSLEDSQCLRDKSCAAMVSDGDCSRLKDAKKRVVAIGDAAPYTTTPARICKD